MTECFIAIWIVTFIFGWVCVFLKKGAKSEGWEMLYQTISLWLFVIALIAMIISQILIHSY